ncbi:MAG TPA: cytochrome C biogenesis protein CcdA [Persephonella sp.]|uniref:C-type cytochrome biogenesis protein n=1 Tax=Persephonella marina (strain DSM 14350 / EX-H1) TaxID=123214 RepID=C0QS61_PERMH|nr:MULTISPECIES: cytochrome c biogenesis protein CcdA [Persephonella]ACO03821.1 C-type cytochrome biogenesis protein [Persephonella marina EX-H1]HCB69251.1 cytochrome C biogenesis protein CcdA [Persephonella sp.]
MVESVSIWAAFFAGLIAFLSPCVLPIIPGYIAYISGISVQSASQNNNRIDWSVVYAAIAFVVGFSIVFTALGAASTFVGQLLQEYKTIISKIAAVLVILLGVHFTGVFQSENVKKWLFVITGISLLIYGYGVVSTGNILNDLLFLVVISISLLVFYFSGAYRVLYQQKTTEIKKKPAGIIGAFIVGVAFAFGWTPCIGPILGAILLYASQQETVMQGVTLLFAFSMGLGIPFIITAAAINQFFRFFNFMRRYFLWIEILGGILLIMVGILILTGSLEKITAFFL